VGTIGTVVVVVVVGTVVDVVVVGTVVDVVVVGTVVDVVVVGTVVDVVVVGIVVDVDVVGTVVVLDGVTTVVVVGTVVEVVVVGTVVDVVVVGMVVVLDGVATVVVVVGSHVQFAVQKPHSPPMKAPPGEPESHASPGSISPLPQRLSVVVVGVVVVVVVVLVDAPIVVVVVVVLVDALIVVVVVVVAVGSGAQSTTTLRPVESDLAQAAPTSMEARPKSRCALGAVMKARTSLWAPTWSLSPVTLSNGVGVPESASKLVSFPSRTGPPTLIVDWVAPVTLNCT